jgi:hypothetical protein
MRTFIASIVVLGLACMGCPAAGTPVVNERPRAPRDESPTPGAAPARGQEPAPVAPERRVWAYLNGERRVMDLDDARSRGLTIVDLSDDWVPYIFWSRTPGKDDYQENDFLDDYVDLANDRIDVDGVALPKSERNYFEVYGIPPSLGVLRQRFLGDEKKECYRSLEYGLFKEYYGPIRIVDPQGSGHEEKRYQSARAAFRRALRQARVKTLKELLERPEHRKVAETFQKHDWIHRAMVEMQRRLVCEGMFGRTPPREKPGVITWATNQALRTFERKHNIYGWGMVFQPTSEALGRTPLENNYESLKRVLTERVVSAAGILEDGTAGKAFYRSASGEKVRVRNLIDEFTRAIIREMGLASPERALEFMREHDDKSLQHLFVAVRLPPVPEYYAGHMDLSVVTDRGDVWYEFPFDEKGRRKNQPRGRMPHLTLFVSSGGQSIPLVRWQTTIGGWQPEMRHDEEYYKYKVSDVGPRIWRNIVAGPVWVPPPNTPSRDMVKVRPVRGSAQPIVAHQAFGPGYASAYGLVAAFHVTKAGHDNQVRTHGSVNYMSILSSFSHGCHRLFNFRAVRLFSFVLSHRRFERKGQSKLGYSSLFDHKGEDFNINLATRGYYYELKPPVPVNVLEGNIRGELKEPIADYVKKPTVVYQDDLRSFEPKEPAGKGKAHPGTPADPMKQNQNL